MPGELRFCFWTALWHKILREITAQNRIDDKDNRVKRIKLINEQPHLIAFEELIAFIHPRTTFGVLIELIQKHKQSVWISRQHDDLCRKGWASIQPSLKSQKEKSNVISPKPLRPDKDRAGFFYGYLVVIASFLIMLGMWASCYAFGVFFKPLLEEFGWTRALTSGAFSLSSLTSGLLAVGMGRLTDRFGPRLVITLCGVFLSLGYCFMFWTNVL